MPEDLDEVLQLLQKADRLLDSGGLSTQAMLVEKVIDDVKTLLSAGPRQPRCEEASMFSVTGYIPCNAPATTIVFHGRRERPYWMCDSCADHNVKNRGGRVLWKQEK